MSLDQIIDVAESLLWVGVLSYGAHITFGNYRDARRDQEALRLSGRNGVRKLIADTAARIEKNRLTTLALFVVVGLSGLFPIGGVLFKQLFIVGPLMIGAFLITFNSNILRDTNRRLKLLIDDDLANNREQLRIALAELERRARPEGSDDATKG